MTKKNQAAPGPDDSSATADDSGAEDTRGADQRPDAEGEPVVARQTPQGFVRRYRLVLGGVALLILVVAVSGLTAWGVTSTIENTSAATSATAPNVPTQGAPSHAPAAKPNGRPTARIGVRGTVTAISGSTWTIAAKSGATVTVSISPSTMYGTAKAPESASDFTVGSTVVVFGTRTQNSVTATRIVSVTPAASQTPAPNA